MTFPARATGRIRGCVVTGASRAASISAACYTQRMPENFFDALIAAADPPVFVVTLAAGGRRAGCLVGFATQVAIEPRRFLVCLSKVNRTYRLAQHAEFVGVHLIGRDHTSLAMLFGGETGDEIDKFAHCSWQPGPHEVPVLDDAAAWFCGRVLDRHDFGDHVGLFVAPEMGESLRSEPGALRYHDVANLEPGHPA